MLKSGWRCYLQIQRGSEYQTIPIFKWSEAIWLFNDPIFSWKMVSAYWMGIQVIRQITWLLTIQILSTKKPVFKCFWILGFRYSDPHWSKVCLEKQKRLQVLWLWRRLFLSFLSSIPYFSIKGAFINDVTQIWTIFNPPPPLSKILLKLYALLSQNGSPPSPSLRDVIYEWPLR